MQHDDQPTTTRRPLPDASSSASASFIFRRPGTAGGNDDTTTSTTIRTVAEERASLRALKEALADVPHEQASALFHVRRVAPELCDDEHMMKFLRLEDFDVPLALNTLLRYWSKRYKIFGPDDYALPMTLAGAMKDEIPELKRGYLTLLPVRDEAGRAIIYIRYIGRYVATQSKLRMLWYLLHVIMHGPHAASGYIVLSNAEGARISDYDPKWVSQASTLCDRSFPVRWRMVHLCQANAVFPLVSQAVRVILSSKQRQSFLMHNGTDERVLETLAEHQLPRHCVPTDLGGTLRLSTEDFLRDRLSAEGGSVVERTANDCAAPDRNGPFPRGDQGVAGGMAPPCPDALPSSEVSGSKRPPPNDDATADEMSSVTSIRRPARALWRAAGNPPVRRDPPPLAAASTTTKTTTCPPRAKHGRRGDPRMNRAVQAKVTNPDMSLLAALIAGGFVFTDLNASGVSMSMVEDKDGVTVYQRRNQLLRRLRYIKNNECSAAG